MEPFTSLLLLLLFLVVGFYTVKLAADYFGAPAPILQIIGLIMLLYFIVRALPLITSRL